LLEELLQIEIKIHPTVPDSTAFPAKLGHWCGGCGSTKNTNIFADDQRFCAPRASFRLQKRPILAICASRVQLAFGALRGAANDTSTVEDFALKSEPHFDSRILCR
jgi:hypothetical protein